MQVALQRKYVSFSISNLMVCIFPNISCHHPRPPRHAQTWAHMPASAKHVLPYFHALGVEPFPLLRLSYNVSLWGCPVFFPCLLCICGWIQLVCSFGDGTQGLTHAMEVVYHCDSVHCQLDRMKNCLGDGSLGVSTSDSIMLMNVERAILIMGEIISETGSWTV